MQANTHSLFQQRSDEGTVLLSRKKRKMTIQRPGALDIRPPLHNDCLSNQFTGKCVIAVQSTVSYNLNHITVEPERAFASSPSKPLGLYQAEFHNPKTMGNTKQARFKARR